MNGVRGVAVWESFRAGAGGFDSGAHPEWANIYDQAAAPLKAGAAGPTWLPGLQVCTRSQSCPRTDLEWAHPAVPQGPDREGESRSNRVSRRSPAGPANDGFADRHLQQPARVSPRDRQGVLAAFLARPIVVFKAA